MNSSIDTLILDFDGTIADTRWSIVSTMKAAFRELGERELTDHEVIATIGIPLIEGVRILAKSDNMELVRKLTDKYREIYNTEKNYNTVTIFPEVADTLKKAHESGMKLAIASSRSTLSLIPLSRMLGILPYLDYIVDESLIRNKKPAPDMAIHILEHFSITPDRVLVVGDTSFDILMGKGAGCRTCGVTYGNQSRRELLDAGADYVADRFSDILTFLA